MSTITGAGTLSCGALQAIMKMADSVYKDTAATRYYDANIETLMAILDNQTVNFPDLQTDKWNQVKLIWLEMCGKETTACTDLCDDGTYDEIQSGCDTHELSCLAEVGFSIKQFEYDSTEFDFQMAVAKGFLAKLSALDEKLSELAVSALVSYGGVNKFEDGIFEGTDFLYVPPQYWGADLMGQLSMAAKINKFKNPFLISGTQLYMANWNADMNSGNADGKGAATKFKSFPMYNDLFNVDSIAGKSTFLIDPNAVAFISKARYSTDPDNFVNGADKTLFAIKSKNIPGVVYDVIYDTVCTDNDIVHRYKIKATGKYILNPTGCDQDITGVLQFTCGNPDS